MNLSGYCGVVVVIEIEVVIAVATVETVVVVVGVVLVVVGPVVAEKVVGSWVNGVQWASRTRAAKSFL